MTDQPQKVSWVFWNWLKACDSRAEPRVGDIFSYPNLGLRVIVTSVDKKRETVTVSYIGMKEDDDA